MKTFYFWVTIIFALNIEGGYSKNVFINGKRRSLFTVIVDEINVLFKQFIACEIGNIFKKKLSPVAK